MHNPLVVLDNETHKLLWDFNIQMDHIISARRPDLIVSIKKDRYCKILDFAKPADRRVKLKEIEKKDKYLEHARDLKKLWNMKETVLPIVRCVLGTFIQELLKGLENLKITGRVETILTTTLLRMARILRRVLKTSEDLLLLKLQ